MTNNQEFKADAGKAMPDLFELGFANAIRLAQATLEYGCVKYEAHSWVTVENGIERYNRAGSRHRQDRQRDWTTHGLIGAYALSLDAESGLPHAAHEIFNLMACLEISVSAMAAQHGVSPNEFVDNLISNMLTPPMNHKEPKDAIS